MAFISLDTPIIQIIWGVLGFGGSAALSASCQDLHSRISNIMTTAPPMQPASLLKCVPFTLTWADLEQLLVSLGPTWKVVVEIVQSAVADLEVDADDTLSWPS